MPGRGAVHGRGHTWQGGRVWWGVCMARRACMAGACIAGGVHGKGGLCGWGGCAWQGGHAWWGGHAWQILRDTVTHPTGMHSCFKPFYVLQLANGHLSGFKKQGNQLVDTNKSLTDRF